MVWAPGFWGRLAFRAWGLGFCSSDLQLRGGSNESDVYRVQGFSIQGVDHPAFRVSGARVLLVLWAPTRQLSRKFNEPMGLGFRVE